MRCSVTDHIRMSLIQKAGMTHLYPDLFPSYLKTSEKLVTPGEVEKLYQSEWSTQFEELQRNRLVMGAFRHGTVADNIRLNRQYDRVGSIQHRLKEYIRDGCLEHLVDIANLAQLEFVHKRARGVPFTLVLNGTHHAEELK